VSLPPQWIPGTTQVVQALTSAGIPWNPDQNSGNPIGLGFVWNSFDKKTRTTSYSAYLHKSRPQNLTIRTNSPAHKIILQNRRAVGVEVDGREEVFATKEVILTCGAINTPQLLMVSGIGPSATLKSAAVPTVVDLAGAGQALGDHVRVHLVAVIDTADLEATDGIPPQFDTALIHWCRLPSVWTSDEYRALAPETQRFIAMPRNPTCELYLTIVPHPNDPAVKLLNIMIANMNSQSTGTISIATSNPQNALVIDPNLLGHEFDRRVLAEGVKAGMEIFKNSALSPRIKQILRAPESSMEQDVQNFLSQWGDTMGHTCGTAKMGLREDLTACVDREFKVIGIDGLRIADLSVCPFTPNAHTQSIAYVIGWMAASKLISEYSAADSKDL